MPGRTSEALTLANLPINHRTGREPPNRTIAPLHHRTTTDRVTEGHTHFGGWVAVDCGAISE